LKEHRAKILNILPPLSSIKSIKNVREAICTTKDISKKF